MGQGLPCFAFRAAGVRRRFFRGLLALVMIVVATASGARTIVRPGDDLIQGVSPFAAVVSRNWARWSNGQASVSRHDLIARMRDAGVRGEDAAALVALEVHLRKQPDIDRDAALAVDDERIVSLYYDNVLKLRAVRRVLFANGQPSFERLQQGPAGDCYFFSATGWMARFRPQVLMSAIVPLVDDRYRVAFPNGETVEVAAPTDAELAVNDSVSTLSDGLWMSVLEKATGTIQQQRFSRSAAIPDPTVAIDTAGIPIASVVERWSGRASRAFHLGARADRTALRTALTRLHERKLLATALILHRPAAKLPYDHVYAIIDFDAASEQLLVWNPWGTDFTPDGPSGPENGYARQHGLFSLSLEEFMRFFTFMAMED